MHLLRRPRRKGRLGAEFQDRRRRRHPPMLLRIGVDEPAGFFLDLPTPGGELLDQPFCDRCEFPSLVAVAVTFSGFPVDTESAGDAFGEEVGRAWCREWVEMWGRETDE